MLVSLALFFLFSHAEAGPRNLTKEELKTCAQLAKQGFKEWKKPDLARYPKPSTDAKSYPHELPVVFNLYNHKGGFLSYELDDEEVVYHLEQLRQSFRPCGIEPTIEGVHFYEGPKFLDDLARDADGKLAISAQERCLLAPTFKPGYVNIYFVEASESANAKQGHGGTHAISRKAMGNEYEQSALEDRRFVGAAIITDAPRTGQTSLGVRGREVAVPHEVGHIVFDSGHYYGPGRRNLMHGEGSGLALDVTKEQCELARRSPFVRRRQETAPARVEVEVTKTDQPVRADCDDPSAAKKVCTSPQDAELLKIAYCDSAHQYVNPYTIAYNPGLGTSSCRNELMNTARAQATATRHKSDSSVLEGGALYVFEEMRATYNPGNRDLVQSVARALSGENRDKSDDYCRKIGDR